jgi:phosphoribosylglycinamide formyltransferase 1
MSELLARPEQDPPVLGVLVSGRGSNLDAILRAIEAGMLRARVGLVISGREQAPALAFATARGIPTATLTLRGHGGSRLALGEAIVARLRAAQVDLVVLGGYHLIFDPVVVRAYPNRILNIHPSLLPAFAGGMAPKPQADALAAGVKISGCTAHLVTEELDAGPIIAQATVAVRDDDSVESLSERILAQEHELLPRAIALVLSGTLLLDGKRVIVAREA